MRALVALVVGSFGLAAYGGGGGLYVSCTANVSTEQQREPVKLALIGWVYKANVLSNLATSLEYP